MVIGCAGSGKSTLARQLAGLTGLPLVERDGLGEEGSPGYLSAIAAMASRPRWILDGAPYYANELVYSAADTVVFLDYRRPLVMWRVLRRTASVELFRRPAGAHRPAGLSALRDTEHPIRWAWTSHADRHREGLALMARPGLAHTQICASPAPRWRAGGCARSGQRELIGCRQARAAVTAMRARRGTRGGSPRAGHDRLPRRLFSVASSSILTNEAR